MLYRRFGQTEIQMPVFSCGGMRYQQSWDDAEPDAITTKNQANVEATIHRAIELGINHIETARGYGTSEMQLGRFLRDFDRDAIIVQTKVAPTENADDFERTFEESMGYLGLDHIDLFSIHGINNLELLDQTIRPGGCLERARKFQSDGRVRHIGFATHGTCGEITRAIETDEFAYVNQHWYFVNDFNWPAVQAAARRDMGVFIISPSDKGGKLYAPPPKLRRLCEPLSPIAFNDLYCLARPEVHTLSIGAARPSDFDEHVAALAFIDRPDLLAPIEAGLREEMREVLGADWVEGWWAHLPEHYDVPGNINLLEILRLWSLARSLDLHDFAQMRYNLLGNAGHWFPGKNAAEFDADKIRECIAGNPFADKIPKILMEAHELLHGEEQKRLSESSA